MIKIERFPYPEELTKEEKKLLVEVICMEQTRLIAGDHTVFKTNRYKMLEDLKVKIKKLGG